MRHGSPAVHRLQVTGWVQSGRCRCNAGPTSGGIGHHAAADATSTAAATATTAAPQRIPTQRQRHCHPSRFLKQNYYHTKMWNWKLILFFFKVNPFFFQIYFVNWLTTFLNNWQHCNVSLWVMKLIWRIVFAIETIDLEGNTATVLHFNRINESICLQFCNNFCRFDDAIFHLICGFSSAFDVTKHTTCLSYFSLEILRLSVTSNQQVDRTWRVFFSSFP